jgi:hypothetical protein
MSHAGFAVSFVLIWFGCLGNGSLEGVIASSEPRYALKEAVYNLLLWD